MKFGIVSKEEHCKPHKKALIRLGHKVKVLGGDDGLSIPRSIDALILRVQSCSHAASDVALQWHRDNPTALFIRENGVSGMLRELKSGPPIPTEPALRTPERRIVRVVLPIPNPTPQEKPDMTPPTPRATRSREAKESQIIAAIGAGHRTVEAIKKHTSLKGKHAVPDGLRQPMKDGRIINLRKRGTGVAYYILGHEEGEVELPPAVPKALQEKRRAAALKAAATRRRNKIAALRDEAAALAEKGNGVSSSSTPALAPAREASDHPVLATDTIQEESELIVLWMREWNVKSVTIDEDGRVCFSNKPTKAREILVRFEWDD